MCLLFSGLTEKRPILLLKLIIADVQIPATLGCQTIQISGSIDTKNITVDPVGYNAGFILREAGERFINHKRTDNLLTVSIKCHKTSLRVLNLCKNWPVKDGMTSALAPFG